MGAEEVIVAYVDKVHKNHQGILSGIAAKGYQYHEMNLPEDAGACSIQAEVEAKVRGCKVLVVYISKKGKTNPCLTQAINYAKQDNKKIIALWVEDDAEVGDMNADLERHASCVVASGDRAVEMLDSEEEVWENPEGGDFPEREIKHYKC